MFSLFLGFLLGALTIIVVEALALLVVVNRLIWKNEATPTESRVSRDLDPEQSLDFAYNKQGLVWVLESEKVPRPEDKLPREQKSKKEIFEVFPVKRYAKIKDRSLILTDSDGSHVKIWLVGCMIAAVSATNLSSRKWAKRYPIKVESKSSVVYNGSKTCYIYLETSWEKESWCKALRLASCDKNERLNWYSKLSEEFHSYLTSLNARYPSFLKPSTGFYGEPTDRANRLDGSSSKVRLLLKKFAKKASKNGVENKVSGSSFSGREERKIGEKSRSFHDIGSVKTALTEKTVNNSLEEDTVLPLQSTLSHSGSQSQISVTSEADSDDKFVIDEGTLCWNLLISRLFFDAKRNAEMKSFIQARIQRTLSNMRTPSYIGGVTCTDFDPGNLPPYIRSMRVLPMDMNEVWAMELDIEYSGGAILDIETRLEVREPDFQKGIVSTSLESSSVEEATSGLLEGFEYFGNQLKLSEKTVDEIKNRDEGGNTLDGLKDSKSTSWKSTYVSRWKSIINSIANQVSQVPLSLAITVASLRGTVRLHIKPPPSDQLWFGFTSMPDIDFNLESSVGEHKIASGHVALLLGSRFKAAIRETFVLPNCESICIPWMLAEKDDWVPRKDAPFIWVNNQEAVSDPTVCEAASCQAGEAKTKLEASRGSKKGSSNHLEDKHEKTMNIESVQRPTCESVNKLASSSERGLATKSPTIQSNCSESLQDLRAPLLRNDEAQENYNQSRPESPEYQAPSGSEIVTQEHDFVGEDAKSKKTGRKARFMDLGKKMGDKFEEKRRNIEEKGRHIVDKMRGP